MVCHIIAGDENMIKRGVYKRKASEVFQSFVDAEINKDKRLLNWGHVNDKGELEYTVLDLDKEEEKRKVMGVIIPKFNPDYLWLLVFNPEYIVDAEKVKQDLETVLGKARKEIEPNNSEVSVTIRKEY